MRSNNYFKVHREPFYFDDRSLTSIESAYDAATQYQRTSAAALGPAEIVVWERPKLHGPWSHCMRVGETKSAGRGL